MARLYSRRKGKSSSKKPIRTESPTWVKYSAKDVENLVTELGKGGKQPAEIGLILRDQYGVPSVKLSTKKSVSSILGENNITSRLPADLTDLIKCASRIKKHMGVHRGDMDGKRGLQLTEAKIRRLAKYYKGTGVLPKDWKYENERLEFLGG